jgi:WD40 repeat protein
LNRFRRKNGRKEERLFDAAPEINSKQSTKYTLSMTTLSPPPPLKARFRGHRGAVISLGLAPAPSPVSKPAFFASGSEDGSCRVWDVETGKATRGFTFQNTSFGPNAKLPVTSVCFGDGGNALYCSRGNSVGSANRN